MNTNLTTRNTCPICSADTDDRPGELCELCERRMAVAIQKMGVDGAVVFASSPVN
jgi:hypothetical protein